MTAAVRWLIPLLMVVFVAGSWLAWGWAGLAFAIGGLLMWLLLHVNRMMFTLRRAARRPIGHVDSAVMLQARLQPGLPLLQVLALTRALGQKVSAGETQPEIYVWTDPGGAAVQAEFRDGRLTTWTFTRPPEAPAGP